MSDHKKVNTSEDYEKDYILRKLDKSKSKENRDTLDELTKDYKKENNIKVISDKDDYYKFLKKNIKKFKDIQK